MLGFEQTWQLFRPFTMVKKARYISSLCLAVEASHVPGDIVECGVWRGGMIAGIAQTLGNHKHYWLFDSFEGLPAADLRRDGRKATTFTGTCKADEHHAKQAMELAGIDNYEIRKGWFQNTLPEAQFPNGISVLRLDGDWYASTITCLEYLYPQVNSGGVIVIDDYFYWHGCRQAVHDYLSRHQITDTVQQTGSDPVAYLRRTVTREGMP